jgi:anti-anti-sigma regulatory factor
VLRITSSTENSRPTTLKLEGRIAGDWVGELTRTVSMAIGTPFDLVLDLAGVTFVDRTGVAVLRDLQDRGIELVNCSEFVWTLVNGDVE